MPQDLPRHHQRVLGSLLLEYRGQSCGIWDVRGFLPRGLSLRSILFLGAIAFPQLFKEFFEVIDLLVKRLQARSDLVESRAAPALVPTAPVRAEQIPNLAEQ